uniref:Uncharacterized protein n=1 Tax=uncultured Desulfobacterium sp. TaxID=201089 RepID=E1YJS9_9BACT|nr:unknown protein [uncultured Desulfobacterium sp.]
MKAFRVVADSSCLIGMAQIGFRISDKLYKKMFPAK